MAFNADYSGLFEDKDEEQLFDEEDYKRRRFGIPPSKDEKPISVEEMIRALEGLESEKERIKTRSWYQPEGDSEAEQEYKMRDAKLRGVEEGGPEYRKGPGEIPEYSDEESEEGEGLDELLEKFAPRGSDEHERSEGGLKKSIVEVAKKEGKGKPAGVKKEVIELSGDVFGPKKKTMTGKDEDPLKGLEMPTERPWEEEPGIEEEELPWLLGGLAGGALPSIGKGIAKKLGGEGLKKLSGEGLAKAGESLLKEAAPLAETAAKEAGTGVAKRFPSALKKVKLPNVEDVFPIPETTAVQGGAKQLAELLKGGKLTPMKYKQILRLLGKSEGEIQRAVATAFR